MNIYHPQNSRVLCLLGFAGLLCMAPGCIFALSIQLVPKCFYFHLVRMFKKMFKMGTKRAKQLLWTLFKHILTRCRSKIETSWKLTVCLCPHDLKLITISQHQPTLITPLVTLFIPIYQQLSQRDNCIYPTSNITPPVALIYQQLSQKG